MFEFCRNACVLLPQPRRLVVLASAVAGLVLTACSSNFIYKPEVVQGNFVSREQVQALRAGMPRQAVRDVLGTPLVTSLFHAERWDYAFTIRRQGAEPQQRRFSVFFKGDALDRIEGDALPTEAEFAAKLDNRRPPTKLPVLKATESDLAKFPVKPDAASVPALPAAPGGSVSYPPLEAAR
ncbi:outer membrane protein assembly factor BamE [Limnohabitans sp.]|uniref:outer membrane protein assembly factor BamE n=1 Tax=Limnohabitans sp. TaxID=1907725 RepID=UPI003FA5D1CF